MRTDGGGTGPAPGTTRILAPLDRGSSLAPTSRDPIRRAAGRRGPPGRSTGRCRDVASGSFAAFWGMCGSSSCRISAWSRLSLLPPSSTPLSISGLRSERSKSPFLAWPPWHGRHWAISSGETPSPKKGKPLRHLGRVVGSDRRGLLLCTSRWANEHDEGEGENL